jgi:hypothetical protein
MPRFALLLAATLVACSDDSFDVASAVDAADTAPAADTASSDTSRVPDAMPTDTETRPDTSGGQCALATDCRLFPSYCVSHPCECLAVPKGAEDPSCDGEAVSCTIDPCLGKLPACESRTCVAK